MSTQDTAVTAPHGHSREFAAAKSLAGLVFSPLTGPIRAIVKHYRVSRDIDELKALSDGMLRDIGIHRSEIMSVVHGKTSGREERRHDRV